MQVSCELVKGTDGQMGVALVTRKKDTSVLDVLAEHAGS